MTGERLRRFGQDARWWERLAYRVPLLSRRTRLYRERAALRDAAARRAIRQARK